AIVIGRPGGGAVDQRLGEDDDVPRLDRRLDHVVRPAPEVTDVGRQAPRQVALVASGHTAKPAVADLGGRQEEGDDSQTVTHDTVAVLVPVIGVLVALGSVQILSAATLPGEDAEVVVEPKSRADELDE